MTIDEVVATGTIKMRLPWWNKHAVAEVFVADEETKALGPWVTVTDVMGPVKVLISECDKHNEWEPVN